MFALRQKREKPWEYGTNKKNLITGKIEKCWKFISPKKWELRVLHKRKTIENANL